MEAFQTLVLSWYKKHGRKLPWRETTDPYKILVSEMMLQQTQVDRVIPKYEAFLKAFPTAESLASASTGDVLRLWSGLGYNRRALYLQKCAQAVMKTFPKESEALQTLPGIGSYTAAAVLSFAFNKDIVVVDVNIELLYKRIFYPAKNVSMLAQRHLPSGHSRDWHNALMDIGALYCTSVAPKCTRCPLKAICASASNEKRIEATRKKKIVVPFKQSDRIVRGAILKLLTTHTSIDGDTVYDMLKQRGIERDTQTFQRIVAALEKDRLVIRKKNILYLP